MNKIEDLNLEELTPEQLHELMYKIYNYYRENALEAAVVAKECHDIALQQGRYPTAQIAQVFKLLLRLWGMPTLTTSLYKVNENICDLLNCIDETIDWERTDDEELRATLTCAKTYFRIETKS